MPKQLSELRFSLFTSSSYLPLPKTSNLFRMQIKVRTKETHLNFQSTFSFLEVSTLFIKPKKEQRNREEHKERERSNINTYPSSMGRRIPSTAISTINPVISLSLLAGWIAVTISIIATLCAARSRKTSPPSPAHSSTRKSQRGTTEPEVSGAATTMSSPLTSTTIAVNNLTEETTPKVEEQQQISSPKLKDSPSRLFRTKQKLSSTLSMKLPRSSLSKIRTRKEGQQKQENSLWTKTIMLGERCKVPTEEDDIIYDQKGNRVTSYRSKTPRSLPVSRSNSLLDQESLPFK